MRTGFGLLLATLTAGALPAQSLTPSGPLRQERTMRGDTIVVRAVSGSTWGDRVRLVEELRIGSLDEGPESFGFIQAFAVLRDGSIAIFDGSVPALRIFGADGRHLRTLGRRGAGPGEYQNQALGLVVDPAGNLVMYDPNNARLNRWAPDGTVLPSWSVPGRLFTAQSLQVDTTGTLMVKVLLEPPQPGRDWRVGLARLNARGEITDTILPPSIEGPAVPGGTVFSPRRDWATLRSGGTISGHSGRYSIVVSRSGQRSLRVERAVPVVRVQPAERAAHQERIDAMLRQSRQSPERFVTPPDPVPAEKPAYRMMQVDLDGRIWVQISMPSERYDPPPSTQGPPPVPWREPSVWDVFQPDGTYLGQLRLPWRTAFQAARGDQVWAVQRGDDDEQYLVRYRIVK